MSLKSLLTKKPSVDSSEPSQEISLPHLMATYERMKSSEAVFLKAHHPVFVAYETIKRELAVAEAELKNAVKSQRSTVEGLVYGVAIQQPKRRWLDPATVRSLVPAGLVTELKIITTHEEVDEKVLKMLVSLGKIDESVLDKAYREEDLEPRVMIRPLKEKSNA